MPRNEELVVSKFQALKANKLEFLDLSDQAVDDELLKEFAAVLKQNTSLKMLTLNNHKLTKMGKKCLLEAVQQNTSLLELRFNSCNTPEAAIRDLLRRSKINDDDKVLVSELEQCITRNNIHHQFLQQQNIAEGGVSNLDLNHMNVKFSVLVPLLEALRTNQTIKEFSLEGIYIGDDGAKAIAELIKSNKSIVRLNLKDCSIGPLGALDIALALAGNSSIKSLDFSGSNSIYLKDMGVLQFFIQAILTNPNFKEKDAKLRLPDQQNIIDDVLSFIQCQSPPLFCKAAQLGNLNLVIALYTGGADIEEKDEKQDTALCLATKCGHEEVVKFLVEMGADTQYQGLNEVPPSRLALATGHMNIHKLLQQAEEVPDWLQKVLTEIANGTLKMVSLNFKSRDIWLNFFSSTERLDNRHIRLLTKVLENNKSVTSLDLKNNNIGETGAQMIKSLLQKNRNITSVELQENSHIRPICKSTFSDISNLAKGNHVLIYGTKSTITHGN